MKASISGVSLDGKHFFYENPLASNGHHHRTPWFICPCCPPNLGRILASLGNYFYSTSEDGVWVHLYGQNKANLVLNNAALSLRQKTEYPWDGKVELRIDEAQAHSFTLYLRIPGWCEKWKGKVNGKKVSKKLDPVNGYIALKRTWYPGDSV